LDGVETQAGGGGGGGGAAPGALARADPAADALTPV